MRILFFDMEFANGQIGGSVYSIGYLITDEDFHILEGPSDLIMAPGCEWNEYVLEHILAYPREEVEAAPPFSAHYERIKELFASCDIAIGFAVGNDVRALRKVCMRYSLRQIAYPYFDVEKLCALQSKHKGAHGLGGYYAAWCGGDPNNRHRSDGDAIATMELFRAVCKYHHVTPSMMCIAYPECMGHSTQKPKTKTQKKSKAPQNPKSSPKLPKTKNTPVPKPH